ELVLLLGNNAENTSLIPVGVGQAITGHRIQSVGRTHYQRLDTIAYARVVPDLWPELNAYKKGELDIDQLTLKLQVFNYLPPASEAEAIERANAIMEQMQ
ncbi:MAG: hypothetical protein GY815_04750, partial [Gammaproteobacteria bacterium]|nr:hypothetical protein [Gammaproteobacteria bacterium]